MTRDYKILLVTSILKLLDCLTTYYALSLKPITVGNEIYAPYEANPHFRLLLEMFPNSILPYVLSFIIPIGFIFMYLKVHEYVVKNHPTQQKIAKTLFKIIIGYLIIMMTVIVVNNFYHIGLYYSLKNG